MSYRALQAFGQSVAQPYDQPLAEPARLLQLNQRYCGIPSVMRF